MPLPLSIHKSFAKNYVIRAKDLITRQSWRRCGNLRNRWAILMKLWHLSPLNQTVRFIRDTIALLYGVTSSLIITWQSIKLRTLFRASPSSFAIFLYSPSLLHDTTNTSAIIIANAMIMYILLANGAVGRSAPISSTIRSTQINSVVTFFIIITPSPVRFVESLWVVCSRSKGNLRNRWAILMKLWHLSPLNQTVRFIRDTIALLYGVTSSLIITWQSIKLRTLFRAKYIVALIFIIMNYKTLVN